MKKFHFLWRENYVDYLWAKYVTASVYFQHSGILLYEDSVLTGYATSKEVEVVNEYTNHLLEDPKLILRLSKGFNETRKKIKKATPLLSKKIITESTNKELFKLFIALIDLLKHHVEIYRHTDPHYIKHIEQLAIRATQKVTDTNPHEFLAKLLSNKGTHHKKYDFIDAEHELFDILNTIARTRFEAKKIDTPLVESSEKLLREVARRTDLSVNQISNLDLKELEQLLLNCKMPNLEQVNKRQHLFVLRVKVARGKTTIKTLSDQEAKDIVEYDRSASNRTTLKGEVAYPGIVRGVARIAPMLSGPEEYEAYIETLEKTDVLIAPMTAPSLTPAFLKVAAVVTDEGGLMSHAALIAREKKIPCVIGTRSATRTFQEGEIIVVDATNGIVTKDKK